MGKENSLIPTQEQQDRAIKAIRTALELASEQASRLEAIAGITAETFNNLATLSKALCVNVQELSDADYDWIAWAVQLFGFVRNGERDKRGEKAVEKYASDYFFARDVMEDWELEPSDFENFAGENFRLTLQCADAVDIQSILFILQQCGGTEPRFGLA